MGQMDQKTTGISVFCCLKIVRVFYPVASKNKQSAREGVKILVGFNFGDQQNGKTEFR